MSLFLLFLVFFFQAEDGIRDIGVTGVQTCALPLVTFGTASLRTSRRFPTISGPASTLVPVTLPPGRIRLATIPYSTGEAIDPTIGIVVVASLRRRTVVVACAKIKSDRKSVV